MIIDATKMSYFKDPERSTYDSKSKKRRSKKSAEDEVGVIVDASLKGNGKKKTL